MFNFSFDKKILYIVIAILVITSLTSLMTSPGALLSILYGLPGVLIAITFHEFAHGFVAYKLGDNTAKMEGRLSLNPLAHLDPIGTLMLVFLGIGWGKPVHVNPSNYTRKKKKKKGEAIVSAAGPITNIILAFIFAIITFVVANITNTAISITNFGIYMSATSTINEVIINILISVVTINVGLGIFNLIPLPPLDGSKIIMPFLPYKAKQWFINNEQIFYIIFIVLWISGLAGRIISPAISWLATWILQICSFI